MPVGPRPRSTDVEPATRGARPDPAVRETPLDASRTLHRPRLIERIVGATEPVVAVVAPAGYGKTTVLGQVAGRLPGSSTLRIDETDDDPIVLMGHLVDAIGAVRPLDPDLRRTLTTPAEFAGFRGPARLTGALAQDATPLTLLLDDVHLIGDRTALDWLAWILERLPPGVRIVLASRRELLLPVGRLIAEGQLLLLGPRDLALDRDETEQLAALARVPITPAEAATLVVRTEGWPLAVQLLLRADPAGGRAADGDPIRPVGEAGIVRYLRSELLDRMEAGTREWVLRSAVLEDLSGPLCDAAMETSGSLRMLRHLEAENQLLLPQDALRTTYRYHALYRELLLGELDAQLPEERARVAIRAAEWMVLHGRVVEAGRYLLASGDADRFAEHVERHAPRLFWTGNLATAQEWTDRFDRDGVRERYAGVAVVGGWGRALRGDTVAAMRWLGAAERSRDRRTPSDGSPDFRGWIAALRANMMPNGLAAFEADVEASIHGVAPGSFVIAQVVVQRTVRELLRGRLDAAEAEAHAADMTFRAHGAAPGHAGLLGLRAAIALARGDLTAARSHVATGHALAAGAGIEDYPSTGMLFAAGARIAAADGDAVQATALLTRVTQLRPLATVALPLVAVVMRIQAIRAAVMLRESAIAQTLLAELEDILKIRPDMGVLVDEARQLRPIVDGLRAAAPSPWTLTAAELRLLAYLPTHLTFREIAERMFLSPHTIKTQAMSIYGKLEVSSRREAIERAVEVGLLDASVLHQADGTVAIA